MTEKTEGLVAEARRWANGHPNRRSGELMRDLADALEAAARERDAALAAIERIREPEPDWEYEVRNEVHDFKSDYTPDLEQAKRWAQEDVHDFIVRRRKAGPWEACNE